MAALLFLLKNVKCFCISSAVSFQWLETWTCFYSGQHDKIVTGAGSHVPHFSSPRSFIKVRVCCGRAVLSAQNPPQGRCFFLPWNEFPFCWLSQLVEEQWLSQDWASGLSSACFWVSFGRVPGGFEPPSGSVWGGKPCHPWHSSGDTEKPLWDLCPPAALHPRQLCLALGLSFAVLCSDKSPWEPEPRAEQCPRAVTCANPACIPSSPSYQLEHFQIFLLS